jgi:L-alanine-DL-glutamate epimerase-like enolase superfamily enzyme
MLIEVKIKTPHVAGVEGSIERIQDFVDLLHDCCEKYEVEQVRRFIDAIPKEREKWLE